uniref:Uncharacterized protein n=1 Tax=viral metagenome TaxID=1070528 RepID=A0A6C0F5V9_9ZZZZ
MDFQKLSQRELIYLATKLRVDYKDKIDKSLYTELHAIVHHQEKTNPYHGEWDLYRKNCVIHQIFNRIVPKEERHQFIEKHPVELINEKLIENIKEKQFYIKEQQKELVSMRIKEASIDTKIKNYNEIKNSSDKDKAEALPLARKEILNRISAQRHWETTIFRPLISMGWLDPLYLELPGKDSGGWERYGEIEFFTDSDGNGGFNPYEKPDLIYNPSHSIPFRKDDGTEVRNEDILAARLPSVDTVNGIIEIRNKLMDRCKALKEENKNLNDDNRKLLKIIQNNKIDL